SLVGLKSDGRVNRKSKAKTRPVRGTGRVLRGWQQKSGGGSDRSGLDALLRIVLLVVNVLAELVLVGFELGAFLGRELAIGFELFFFLAKGLLFLAQTLGLVSGQLARTNALRDALALEMLATVDPGIARTGKTRFAVMFFAGDVPAD